jgi:hypothetical protein
LLGHSQFRVQINGHSLALGFGTARPLAILPSSQGIPRMINRLALESLHQGCLEGAQAITEELFMHVCKNLGPHLAN